MIAALLDLLFPGKPALGWESVARTDPGRTRDHNEDSVIVSDRARVFAVADGMGGGEMGEVASRCVAQALEGIDPVGHAPVLEVREAVEKANGHLVRMREDKSVTSIGSTLVCLCLPPFPATEGHLLHAGDSRAYLYRRRNLRQLTRDHSLDSEFKEQHVKTPARFKSVITRAVGLKNGLHLEQTRVNLRAGDILMLCSDGLCNMLSRRRMRRVFRSLNGKPLSAIASRLIDQANSAGGKDNISVVLVRFLEHPLRPETPPQSFAETSEPETVPTRKT